MNEQEKNLNALLVDALNVWFAKEGLTVNRPKRENTRTFKIGRRHRVKYHKVIIRGSREIKIAFSVGDLRVYIPECEWPCREGDFINHNCKRYDKDKIALFSYIFEVSKLEPLNDSVGYITLIDNNLIIKEVDSSED